MDQTNNFTAFTQLSVPATLGFQKSVPFILDALELRDALQEMVDWCEVPYCETYQPVIKARGALKEVAKLTATAHKPAND
jgi:hypothetical protein